MTHQVEESKQSEEEVEVIDLFADGADDLILASENDEAATAESQEPQKTDVAGADAAPDVDESIPEKFRGKSAAEIAASYAELEREHSRRGNELGELRKVTDDILRAQLTGTETKQDKPAEITSDELLANPQAVIDMAVANSPVVKKAEKVVADTELSNRADAFKKAVPNAQEIMGSAQFGKWLDANPYRAKRFAEADANYDFDTAAELLLTYQEVATVNSKANEETRDKDLNKLDSPKTGGGGDTSKKPVFSRADLMRLKDEDPDRYQRLQPQIQLAYIEKRVK